MIAPGPCLILCAVPHVTMVCSNSAIACTTAGEMEYSTLTPFTQQLSVSNISPLNLDVAELSLVFDQSRCVAISCVPYRYYLQTMTDNVPITLGVLVGLFTECICYGILLVTLAQCLRSLLWSDDEHSFKKKINWPMLIVALLMTIIATLDVAFGLRQILAAFVYYTGPGGAAVELESISYVVTKIATSVTQTIIGDGMLLYRCYLVYDKKWYFAAPSFLLWIAGSGCGVLVIVNVVTLDGTPQDASWTPLLIYCMLGFTLADNVITTSLIVYRIWSIDRQTAQMTIHARRISRLQPIMRILIESAALYTITVIFFTGTYIANSSMSYISGYSLIQVIGIAFNLIIVRVNSGKAYEGTNKWGPGPAVATPAVYSPMRLPLAAFRAHSAGPSVTGNEAPLEITIHQQLTHDAKSGSGQLELHETVPIGNWSRA